MKTEPNAMYKAFKNFSQLIETPQEVEEAFFAYGDEMVKLSNQINNTLETWRQYWEDAVKRAYDRTSELPGV